MRSHVCHHYCANIPHLRLQASLQMQRVQMSRMESFRSTHPHRLQTGALAELATKAFAALEAQGCLELCTQGVLFIISRTSSGPGQLP